MKLHVFPPSPNARKVQFVAQHLQIPHEIEIVDLSQGQQRSPEYLKLNPNGVMPTLTDGDFVLWESEAIMRYLCSLAPGQTLLPSDPKKNADVMRWQAWALANWFPACGTCIFENLVKVLLQGGKPDAARVADGEARVKQHGRILDDYLKGRKFLVGDSLTLADVSNAAPLAFIGPARLPVQDFKEIQRWVASLDQFPAWKATAPQLPGAAASS
jgi:glutathione S-transferase